jgi:glycosyltransferase involved in cell wall biosynthesis
VRVLIFHGYLLTGTGSNVYNACLAEALVGLGHEVHLLSQDRHPERQRFVHAAGDWDNGTLRVRTLRSVRLDRDGSCTVYRPNIGSLLPVYVKDRYECMQARTFAQCSDEEIAHYIDANVMAVQELVERVRPELALANHLVMGPVILARALGSDLPYAVKVHGSALEYTVKPQPERFLALAREGVSSARAVLVGSRHTATSLWDALDDPHLQARTRLGPPGVDVERFRPLERAQAASAVHSLVGRLRASAHASSGSHATTANEEGRHPHTEQEREVALTARERKANGSSFARDELAAAEALERLQPERDRLVAFVGKLIVSKGVDLLIAAWPLVLERTPEARLVIVGFGAYRDGLERLLQALAAGDLESATDIAMAGRALEAQAQELTVERAQEPTVERAQEPTVERAQELTDEQAPEPTAEETASNRAPLRHLLAFFDELQGPERDRYLNAARALRERVVLVGRLDHDELTELLPMCEALVVPSTFPEAFGMVAAEAAACGALPVSAAHSGLAEVSEALARAVPRQAAEWLSFPVDDHAVRALAERLSSWLAADQDCRIRTRAGLISTVRERWSWENVAGGVIAAARGELDRLAKPR